METHKNDYIHYRLEKAEETIKAANVLLEKEMWNSAVNRFYYACFYAVTALLVKAEIETKSHSGVKTQFFLNYVKQGKISMENGRLYADLFDWRQKGDYGDFFDFSESDAKPLAMLCRNFIDAIKQEINKT